MPDRLTRIRAAMAEHGLDGLMISAPGEENLGAETRSYVAGFTGSTGVILLTATRALFAADFRYVEQAEAECGPRGFEVFRASGKRAEWLRVLFADAAIGGKRLGLTKLDTSYGGYLGLTEVIAGLPADERPLLTPAPPIIENLRAQKDAEEVALLQRAVNVADLAFAELLDALHPEMTERQAAEVFRENVKRSGGDDISFETIVASGPHGAMPHAQPRGVLIAQGAPLVVDMGARVAGYCSDLTRTISPGIADAKFREIYSIVHGAQLAAIERIESGMTGAQADDLARSHIARAGYGEQFGHGLGHGVGLQVHEAPHLGATSEDVLLDGMVFTIEPGIYIPGWGGVRIEDIVILENGKPRVLSHAPKLAPQEFEE
ncbi:MAG: aminopeptidase P family protein [Tepidiformaceae bacterium]